MKKFFGLLLLVFLMNGCDDGDVTVDTITFDEVDALTCNLLVYKITGNQAMIIKLPDVSAFVNESGSRTRTIGGDINVTYRAYSATATADAICASPPPIAPIATTEWLATAGIVEITTVPVYTAADPVTGQQKISDYRHSIIFRNIKFAKPDGTDQSYSEYVFGNFFTKPTNLPLNFNPEEVALCPATNTIYNAKNGGKEGLFLQSLNAGLLTNDLGVKTQAITQTDNRVEYRYFIGTLPSDGNEAYFCSPNTNTSTPPGTAEQWIAVNGDGTNGIIEVTTTAFETGVKHSIRLKGVTFKKGASTFYYGNDMLIGELIVP